jgi:hypothetical protein
MMSLDISDNKIGSGWTESTDGSQALSTALKSNSNLKELNISSNHFKADDAKILADGLSGNKAISTVIVNTFSLPIQDIKSKVELDLSGKELKVEDIIIIAALIPSNVSHISPPSCYR